jgi:hypothetical protein
MLMIISFILEYIKSYSEYVPRSKSCKVQTTLSLNSYYCLGSTQHKSQSLMASCDHRDHRRSETMFASFGPACDIYIITIVLPIGSTKGSTLLSKLILLLAFT